MTTAGKHTECPKCGAPITVATLLKTRIDMDLEPDQTNGNILALDGRATYLSGKALRDARLYGCRLYIRHSIKCPHYWTPLPRQHPTNTPT